MFGLILSWYSSSSERALQWHFRLPVIGGTSQIRIYKIECLNDVQGTTNKVQTMGTTI